MAPQHGHPSGSAAWTGLPPIRLHDLRHGAIGDDRPGRQWALDLAARVLLVAAAYWRTNLTMRQIGPLFRVSHFAAHRVIDLLGPVLARSASARSTRSRSSAAR